MAPDWAASCEAVAHPAAVSSANDGLHYPLAAHLPQNGVRVLEL